MPLQTDGDMWVVEGKARRLHARAYFDTLTLVPRLLLKDSSLPIGKHRILVKASQSVLLDSSDGSRPGVVRIEKIFCKINKISKKPHINKPKIAVRWFLRSQDVTSWNLQQKPKPPFKTNELLLSNNWDVTDANKILRCCTVRYSLRQPRGLGLVADNFFCHRVGMHEGGSYRVQSLSASDFAAPLFATDLDCVPKRELHESVFDKVTFELKRSRSYEVRSKDGAWYELAKIKKQRSTIAACQAPDTSLSRAQLRELLPKTIELLVGFAGYDSGDDEWVSEDDIRESSVVMEQKDCPYVHEGMHVLAMRHFENEDVWIDASIKKVSAIPDRSEVGAASTMYKFLVKFSVPHASMSQTVWLGYEDLCLRPGALNGCRIMPPSREAQSSNTKKGHSVSLSSKKKSTKGSGRECKRKESGRCAAPNSQQETKCSIKRAQTKSAHNEQAMLPKKQVRDTKDALKEKQLPPKKRLRQAISISSSSSADPSVKESLTDPISVAPASLRAQLDHARVCFDEGAKLFNEEKYAEAASIITEAIANNHPDLKLCYSWRGVCYDHLDKHELAFKDHDAGIVDGEHPVRYYNRAVKHRVLGRPHDAKRDLERVLALDPDDQIARDYLKHVNAELELTRVRNEKNSLK